MPSEITTKKGNIVGSYLKRTAQIIKGATSEYFSEAMPTLSSVQQDIGSTVAGFTSTYKPSQITNKLNELKKQVSLKNLQSWFLKSSDELDNTDQDLDASLGLDIELDDSDDGGAQLVELPVEEKNARLISKTVVDTSHKLAESQIVATANLMSGIDRIGAALISGFDNINSTLGKLLEVTTTNTGAIVTAVTASSETTTKETPGGEKMLSSGKFDFRDYLKMVSSNVQSSELGLLSMLPMLLQGDMLTSENLIGGGMKWLVNKFQPNLKKNLQSIDSVLNETIMGGLARLGELDDNSEWGLLGKIFGIRADRKEANFKNSSLEYKEEKFNTVTQEAIVAAIPGYLRKILDQLGGGDWTYDYKARSFRSRSDIKKDFEESITSTGNLYKANKSVTEAIGTGDVQSMLYDLALNELGSYDTKTAGETVRGFFDNKEAAENFVTELLRKVPDADQIKAMPGYENFVSGLTQLSVNGEFALINQIIRENLRFNRETKKWIDEAKLMHLDMSDFSNTKIDRAAAITEAYGVVSDRTPDPTIVSPIPPVKKKVDKTDGTESPLTASELWDKVKSIIKPSKESSEITPDDVPMQPSVVQPIQTPVTSSSETTNLPPETTEAESSVQSTIEPTVESPITSLAATTEVSAIAVPTIESPTIAPKVDKLTGTNYTNLALYEMYQLLDRGLNTFVVGQDTSRTKPYKQRQRLYPPQAVQKVTDKDDTTTTSRSLSDFSVAGIAHPTVDGERKSIEKDGFTAWGSETGKNFMRAVTSSKPEDARAVMENIIADLGAFASDKAKGFLAKKNEQYENLTGYLKHKITGAKYNYTNKDGDIVDVDKDEAGGYLGYMKTMLFGEDGLGKLKEKGSKWFKSVASYFDYGKKKDDGDESDVGAKRKKLLNTSIGALIGGGLLGGPFGLLMGAIAGNAIGSSDGIGGKIKEFLFGKEETKDGKTKKKPGLIQKAVNTIVDPIRYQIGKTMSTFGQILKRNILGPLSNLGAAIKERMANAAGGVVSKVFGKIFGGAMSLLKNLLLLPVRIATAPFRAVGGLFRAGARAVGNVTGGAINTAANIIAGKGETEYETDDKGKPILDDAGNPIVKARHGRDLIKERRRQQKLDAEIDKANSGYYGEYERGDDGELKLDKNGKPIKVKGTGGYKAWKQREDERRAKGKAKRSKRDPTIETADATKEMVEKQEEGNVIAEEAKEKASEIVNVLNRETTGDVNSFKTHDAITHSKLDLIIELLRDPSAKNSNFASAMANTGVTAAMQGTFDSDDEKDISSMAEIASSENPPKLSVLGRLKSIFKRNMDDDKEGKLKSKDKDESFFDKLLGGMGNLISKYWPLLLGGLALMNEKIREALGTILVGLGSWAKENLPGIIKAIIDAVLGKDDSDDGLLDKAVTVATDYSQNATTKIDPVTKEKAKVTTADQHTGGSLLDATGGAFGTAALETAAVALPVKAAAGALSKFAGTGAAVMAAPASAAQFVTGGISKTAQWLSKITGNMSVAQASARFGQTSANAGAKAAAIKAGAGGFVQGLKRITNRGLAAEFLANLGWETAENLKHEKLVGNYGISNAGGFVRTNPKWKAGVMTAVGLAAMIPVVGKVITLLSFVIGVVANLCVGAINKSKGQASAVKTNAAKVHAVLNDSRYNDHPNKYDVAYIYRATASDRVVGLDQDFNYLHPEVELGKFTTLINLNATKYPGAEILLYDVLRNMANQGVPAAVYAVGSVTKGDSIMIKKNVGTNHNAQYGFEAPTNKSDNIKVYYEHCKEEKVLLDTEVGVTNHGKSRGIELSCEDLKNIYSENDKVIKGLFRYGLIKDINGSIEKKLYEKNGKGWDLLKELTKKEDLMFLWKTIIYLNSKIKTRKNDDKNYIQWIEDMQDDIIEVFKLALPQDKTRTATNMKTEAELNNTLDEDPLSAFNSVKDNPTIEPAADPTLINISKQIANKGWKSGWANELREDLHHLSSSYFYSSPNVLANWMKHRKIYSDTEIDQVINWGKGAPGASKERKQNYARRTTEIAEDAAMMYPDPFQLMNAFDWRNPGKLIHPPKENEFGISVAGPGYDFGPGVVLRGERIHQKNAPLFTKWNQLKELDDDDPVTTEDMSKTLFGKIGPAGEIPTNESNASLTKAGVLGTIADELTSFAAPERTDIADKWNVVLQQIRKPNISELHSNLISAVPSNSATVGKFDSIGRTGKFGDPDMVEVNTSPEAYVANMTNQFIADAEKKSPEAYATNTITTDEPSTSLSTTEPIEIDNLSADTNFSMIDSSGTQRQPRTGLFGIAMDAVDKIRDKFSEFFGINLFGNKEDPMGPESDRPGDSNWPTDSPAYTLDGTVKLMPTKKVAALPGANKRSKRQVIDLTTMKSFYCAWAASSGYHTDWTPWSAEDVKIIQNILAPGGRSDWATNKSAWKWDGRPGVVILDDGLLLAVGYHLRPHGSFQGSNPGPPLKSMPDSKAKGTTWPIGGHMCMYYGDSPGKTSSCNPAARKAYQLGNEIFKKKSSGTLSPNSMAVTGPQGVQLTVGGSDDLPIDEKPSIIDKVPLDNQFQSTDVQPIGDDLEVTSEFGPRSIDGKKSFHRGLDIAPTKDTANKVSPITEGIITDINRSYPDSHTGLDVKTGTTGNYVSYMSKSGLEFRNMHLKSGSIPPNLKVGDYVKPNEKIGLMGSTGRSSGTHLHLGIFKNGKAINPRKVLPSIGGDDLPIDEKPSVIDATATTNESITLDKVATEQPTQPTSDILTNDTPINILSNDYSSYKIDFDRTAIDLDEGVDPNSSVIAQSMKMATNAVSGISSRVNQLFGLSTGTTSSSIETSSSSASTALDSSYTSTSTPGGTFTGTAPISKDTDVAAIIYNFFVSKGISPASTCGILGNIQQECSMNPTLRQKGGPGRGILQWEEGQSNDNRFANLQALARSRGKTWEDLGVQLDFTWKELTSEDINQRFRGKYSADKSAWYRSKMPGSSLTYAEGMERNLTGPARNGEMIGGRGLPGGFEEWRKLTDVKFATSCFEGTFPRAGKPMMKNRWKYAQEYYNRFYGKAQQSSIQSSPIDVSTNYTQPGVGGPIGETFNQSSTSSNQLSSNANDSNINTDTTSDTMIDKQAAIGNPINEILSKPIKASNFTAPTAKDINNMINIAKKQRQRPMPKTSNKSSNIIPSMITSTGIIDNPNRDDEYMDPAVESLLSPSYTATNTSKVNNIKSQTSKNSSGNISTNLLQLPNKNIETDKTPIVQDANGNIIQLNSNVNLDKIEILLTNMLLQLQTIGGNTSQSTDLLGDISEKDFGLSIGDTKLMSSIKRRRNARYVNPIPYNHTNVTAVMSMVKPS